MKRRVQYDADGLLTSAGSLTLTRNSQNGLLTGTTAGNVTDSLSYNGFGEVVGHDASYSGSSVFSETYVRDAVGRIAEKTETVDGATDTYDYEYDPAGRLVAVALNGSTVSNYEYDSNGNRTSYTGGLGAATGTYDNQDRLVTYGSESYTFGAAGEMASRSDTDGTTSYSYDALGNLQSVALSNGTQIQYVIDGRNRRVGKKVNGALVQGFLYDGQLRIIAELDGSSNVVSRFVYGSRGHVPDYMVKGGNTYRIISDHLGSPRLIVDVNSGTIVQRMSFDEFGRVLQDSSPGFQPFGFAGGLYDRDTGLVRFGARDYDADSGRWTAKDPILFRAGDSNLYGYTFNDPVNFIDPLGLTDEGASAAYGETSGLYPQLSTPGSIYNPNNYDEASALSLHDARAWIADIRERNKRTRTDHPDPHNKIQKRIWKDCEAAATEAETSDLPSDVDHFFERQEGKGTQAPWWAEGKQPWATMGPFRNEGGGQVPLGPKTYIDFYKGVK